MVGPGANGGESAAVGVSSIQREKGQEQEQQEGPHPCLMAAHPGKPKTSSSSPSSYHTCVGSMHSTSRLSQPEW